MANGIEYNLKDIKEMVSYLFDYIKQGDIINNVDQEERFNYWCEINHYIAVDLPFALEQAYRNIEYLNKVSDDKHKMWLKAHNNEVKHRQKLEQIKKIATKRDYLDYSECLDDILNLIDSQIPKSE